MPQNAPNTIDKYQARMNEENIEDSHFYGKSGNIQKSYRIASLSEQ